MIDPVSDKEDLKYYMLLSESKKSKVIFSELENGKYMTVCTYHRNRWEKQDVVTISDARDEWAMLVSHGWIRIK